MSRCIICDWCPDIDGPEYLEDGRSNRMMDPECCLKCQNDVQAAVAKFYTPVSPEDDLGDDFEAWRDLGWPSPETLFLELPEGFHDEDDKETSTMP